MADSNNGNVAVLDNVDASEVSDAVEQVIAAEEETFEPTDVDITGEAGPAEEPVDANEDEGEPEGESESAEGEDMLDAKIADPETYIGNSPLKKEFLKLRTLAEKLFGHSSKTEDYVELAFFTRDLHLKQANLDASKGKEFQRSGFIEQVKVLIRNTTTVPDSQNEPSLWLQIVGLICLVRGRYDHEIRRWIPRNEKPAKDWYEGNLCWATLKALAPMVVVDKGSGADTYHFKEGCDQIAVDMVNELQRSILPASDGYVRKVREERVKKALAALAKKKAAALSPDAVETLERQEVSRKLKANYDKAFRAIEKLGELRNEVGYSQDRLRSQLIDQGVIKPVAASDLVGLMATPANRVVASAAILSNVETRKAFIADLAKEATHQDIQDLFNGLLMRVKANPADKAAAQALGAFRTAAAKLQQPQKAAS